MPPEAGELVVSALNTIVEKDVNEQQSQDGPAGSMPQKRADALARMAEHYLATGKDGTRSLAGSM